MAGRDSLAGHLRAVAERTLDAGLDAIDRLKEARIRRAFRRDWVDEAAYSVYAEDLEASGILDHIEEAETWYGENVANAYTEDGPSLGSLAGTPTVLLYILLRDLEPERVVETGVCNGASTAVILQALEDNGTGHLASIDLPDFVDDRSDDHEFWEGKGGAAIPEGREPGWVVPEELTDRWTLTLGKSQDELEPVLEELGSIDVFLHDSEHSYECMRFEYEAAYPRLREGGLLISDDVTWNSAFEELADEVGDPTGQLGLETAFLKKTGAGDRPEGSGGG